MARYRSCKDCRVVFRIGLVIYSHTVCDPVRICTDPVRRCDQRCAAQIVFALFSCIVILAGGAAMLLYLFACVTSVWLAVMIAALFGPRKPTP